MPSSRPLARGLGPLLHAATGRILALAALTAFVLGALSSGTASGAPPTNQPVAHADIVIDFDDGRVFVRRAEFAPPYTGLDLLLDAGIDFEMAGGALCRLDNVGCPGTDCFCACTIPDADCRFWRYHRLVDDAWQMSGVGPAEVQLARDDVDGWVWGSFRAPITTTATTRALLRGRGWLETRLEPDGSLGDHPGLTADWLLAAVATGADPQRVEAALAYLAPRARAYAAESAAATGKLAATVAAAGANPEDFGGMNLPSAISATYSAERGTYGPGTNVWDQAWAMLGLAASGHQVPTAARAALAAMADPAGGWGATPGANPDPDTTGLALQALAAAGAGADDETIRGAVAHLRATRRPGGGWGHGPGDTDNANSTAYAIQGLLAAGENPLAPPWTDDQGTGGALAFLLAAQRPEGRFQHAAAPADLVATVQVLPALAGRTAGHPGAGVASARAAQWINAQRTLDGAFAGFPPGATLDAILALAAAGYDPAAPAPSGATAADYLTPLATEYANRGASAAGKLIAGLVALGHDPRTFAGADIVAILRVQYDPITGAMGAGSTWDNAWSILGLAAAADPVPATVTTYLIQAAADGGGWGFGPNADQADVDSTGLALAALAAAAVPGDHPAVRRAIDALRRLQNEDAGFAGFTGETSVSSTALALVGLQAYGQHLAGPGWWRGTDLAHATPLSALIAGQQQSGAFIGFDGNEDPGATYAALLGLSGRALPVVPAPPPQPLYLPLAIHGQ